MTYISSRIFSFLLHTFSIGQRLTVACNVKGSFNATIVMSVTWRSLHIVYIFCLHCCLKRWVRCYQNDVINLVVSTTNGLERLHESLKYSFLSDTCSGSLTDLLTAIARNFIPVLEQRSVFLDWLVHYVLHHCHWLANTAWFLFDEWLACHEALTLSRVKLSTRFVAASAMYNYGVLSVSHSKFLPTA